jgi:hypothetical protein
MKMLKISAAAALVAASLSASAMTTIADDELSTVAGQDGVSIAADLNINLGAFTYTDTDTNGGSVSFNNITVRGMMAMTIDILNQAAFVGAATAAVAGNNAALTPAQAQAVAIAVGTSLGYSGDDVVQFAFPASGNADAHSVTPTITVGSITTGNGTASFGSMQLKNLDLQGTKVWMFPH